MFFTFFKLYEYYQIAQRTTFYTESNMMTKVVRYLPKSEAAVHRCWQLFTVKRLFMSIFFNKVASLQPNKRLQQKCFLWVCLIFQNTFFQTHLGGDCFCSIPFYLLRQPHQQNVTLHFGYVLIVSKHIQIVHYESLVNSCFWKSKTISWFVADKTSDKSMMLLEIRRCRPAVFFKNYVLLNKKASVMEPLFVNL